MNTLQSRVLVKAYKEEQIALPPVSPRSVFIHTIKLPVQTRFNPLCGADQFHLLPRAASELYKRRILFFFYLIFKLRMFDCYISAISFKFSLISSHRLTTFSLKTSVFNTS
jgi:hypothetical protein